MYGISTHVRSRSKDFIPFRMPMRPFTENRRSYSKILVGNTKGPGATYPENDIDASPEVAGTI